jgi:hypothetical protein
MRKTNWETTEKSAKLIKKNVKYLQAAGDYLKEMPEVGYMKDNISKNLVKISDCKSSSLRRYIKLLDNFYYIVTSQKDKDAVLNKKVEIENELNTREDGIIKKE